MTQLVFRYISLSFILTLLTVQSNRAQLADYYLGNTRYSFIKYDENKIILPRETDGFDSLFGKIDRIMKGGPEQAHIVHMGGSHIQADIYTQRMRKRLQEMDPDMRGARGFLFPYRIAHTNNPSNYRVGYEGTWSACKSTRITDDCRLGLSGMAVRTSDSISSVSIHLNDDADYLTDFDSVRIFHEPASFALMLIAGRDTLSGLYDTLSGCTHFKLAAACDGFKLRLIRKQATAVFTLLGISLDNDAPGVVYNAIGVNGAKLSSYLRCELYEQHLKALQPDLIVISIGTNDGYTRNFNKDLYFGEYSELIKRTQAAVPGTAILLTVPNDSYLYRRYVNRNTELMRKVIFQLAETYHCGIWDFFTIMGGLNSAQGWYSLNLMGGDRVHFTRQGYELKGELLYSAFLKAWEAHLKEIEKRKEINIE